MSSGQLDEIGYDDCLELLRFGSLGRIGITVDDMPFVLPVNYRLIETSSRTWVALRTRIGGVLDRDRAPVAFEIDHVDPREHTGWSVLVRGILEHVDPDAAEFRDEFDPKPWVGDARNRWLIIEPFSITGRHLQIAPDDAAAPALFYG